MGYLSRNSSYIVSSTKSLPAAMQFSPLLKKTLPRAFLIAFSISQSAKKISGDFPPNSSEHFFRFESAQDLMIVWPISVEPVKPSFLTRG